MKEPYQPVINMPGETLNLYRMAINSILSTISHINVLEQENPWLAHCAWMALLNTTPENASRTERLCQAEHERLAQWLKRETEGKEA